MCIFEKYQPATRLNLLQLNSPLRSNKLNRTGQSAILLTMVIAAHTFWYSSLEALMIHILVMSFAYLTAQNYKEKLREAILRKINCKSAYYLPWNDPSDEARPHSPKFTRMLSRIVFVTLYEVMITGSFLTSSLLGSKITSTTIYLFLNPTMILYLLTTKPHLIYEI